MSGKLKSIRKGVFYLLLAFIEGYLLPSQSVAQTKLLDQESDFESMFDGKTLAGWESVPAESSSDWSVQNGVIVGIGSEDRQVYLVWKDREIANFELKFRYRMTTEGNTGVEIRAIPDPTKRRPFQGYHADLGHLEIGPNVLGAWDFHFAKGEQKKRTEHSCPRGTRLVIDEHDQAHRTQIDPPLALADIHRDWNRVHVIAKEFHFQFFINEKLSSEFTDNLERVRYDRGAIGLQLHNRGMRVEFADLRIKRIP